LTEGACELPFRGLVMWWLTDCQNSQVGIILLTT